MGSKPLLIVRPGATEEWESFHTTGPQGKIAADGYVLGPHREDVERDVYSFDHHCEGRLYVRATCAQMRLAILMGMFDEFPSPRYLFVDGYDEDVCLTVRLFFHLRDARSPRMARLVELEDLLDSTSGMFPVDASWDEMLRIAAWIFKPYRDAITATGTMEELEMIYRSVIESVGARIGQYISGRPEKGEVDRRYRRIGGGPGWTMVEPIGADARLGMFADGIRAYLLVRELGNDRWLYTAGRTPYKKGFPLDRIFHRLNKLEGIGVSGLWGGSPIVGGSPKPYGSQVPPKDAERAINLLLREECCGL